MITQKMYRYLGRNGTITSRILLENISPIEMISLQASQGKQILTRYEADSRRNSAQGKVYDCFISL